MAVGAACFPNAKRSAGRRHRLAPISGAGSAPLTEEIADMTERYLEDFAVGPIFASGHLRIDKGRIKAFASEFDPQPFRLDEGAARDTIFRGLAASG